MHSAKNYSIRLYVTIFIERSEKHFKNPEETLPMLIFIKHFIFTGDINPTYVTPHSL